MRKKLRVLVVEDSEDDTLLEVREIERGGYQVEYRRVETREELEASLSSGAWDVILSDFTMPHLAGMEALKIVRVKDDFVPFIFVSGTIGEERAVGALKQGASDYVMKAELKRLVPSIGRELREMDLKIQRKEALDELRASENRYRDLFDSAPVGYHEIDKEGLVARINRKELEMLGCSESEVVGKPAWRFVTDPAASREKVLSKLTERTPVEQNLEQVYLRKDGTTFFSITDESLIKNKQSIVTGIRSVVQDITERKRSEEEISAALQRLSLATNLAQMGIWDLDLSRMSVVCDKKMMEIFGSTADSVALLEQWMQFVVPEDSQKITDSIEQVINSKKSEMLEFRIRRPDGALRDVESAIGVIVGVDGNVLRVVGVVRDITERRQAIEIIREQAALIDESHDAISVLDLATGLILWNKGAEELYGWKASEVMGKNQWQLPVEGSEGAEWGGDEINDANFDRFAFIDDAYRNAFNVTLAEGKWKGELSQKTKSGKEIDVLSRWTLIKNSDGKPKSILFINTDLSDQKAMQAQFRRAQRMELLGTLTSGIAHDLNNVLTPIGLMIEGLQREHAGDEKTMRMLSTVESTLARGTGVVKQILAFARGSEARRTYLDTAVIVEEFRAIIEDTFPKSIKVDATVKKGTGLIIADKTQVQQVLINLSVNARDAMPKGGELSILAKDVEIDENYAKMSGAAIPGDYVLLQVSDTGTGIKKEDTDKLFEPFFTTKETGEGTGLGLSIVREIVESSGGFIEVDSELGKGATFRVYLPSSRLEEEPLPVEREIDPQVGDGNLVIVAEDEAAIREITKSTLEAYDYRVLSASDGSEAVALFALHLDDVAVVITDLAMPIMEGDATIHALRKLKPDVKIIVITGITDESQHQDILASVNAVLKKPYSARILIKTITQVLGAAH